MEARKITVVNSMSQSSKTIMSGASTLGELKNDLTGNHITFNNDCSFTEGISRTALLNDDSQLPMNVTYRGNQTNELVILISATKSKISSGAFERGDLYYMIHNDVNLRLYILEQSGKNFTNISTAELNNLVNNYQDLRLYILEQSGKNFTNISTAELNNLVNNYQEHHTLAHTVTPDEEEDDSYQSDDVCSDEEDDDVCSDDDDEDSDVRNDVYEALNEIDCFDETDINLIMEFIKNFMEYKKHHGNMYSAASNASNNGISSSYSQDDLNDIINGVNQ